MLLFSDFGQVQGRVVFSPDDVQLFLQLPPPEVAVDPSPNQVELAVVINDQNSEV
jgi:hypothetical protein